MRTIFQRTAIVAALILSSAAYAQSNPMVIKRNGTTPAAKGAPPQFTGAVRVDLLQAPQAPARTSAGSVTFEPGARSAWHTHPLGQTLIVTSGTGWVQQEGGAKQEMRAGDVIWTPPGVKHWHGATAANAVTHIAVTENLDGKNVDWMEPVTDEQYSK